MKILAAVDDSRAAPTVVRCALALSRRIPADVACLHASGDGRRRASARPAHVAAEYGLGIAVVEDDAIPAIVAALDDEEVVVGVLASRGRSGGKRPAGHTALAVAATTRKAIVVTPPACDVRDIRRLLVPLEGVDDGAAVLAGFVRVLIDGGVEVVPLHVLTPDTVPAYWDQPQHAMPAWTSGFVSRYAPAPADGLWLRSGDVAEAALEVIGSASIDLVALTWSQDLSDSHAPTVRALLARCPVPVLLIPAEEH